MRLDNTKGITMRNPFGHYKNYIVYKIAPSKSRPGKTDKFPVDFRDGRVKVDPHSPEIQTDFDTALGVSKSLGEGYGIGFVFNDSNPFWFLDIDGALKDGKWSDLAIQICTQFAGCYVEISPSGDGLHIYGTGSVPQHTCKNSRLGLEFYHTARFGTITGINPIGDANFNATPILPGFITDYFPPSTAGNEETWSEGPDPEYRGPYDDKELIRRALASKSVATKFGEKASFQDLWEKNDKVLGKMWPDEKREFDASSADSSLAMRLAFWTGRDCERIERLMKSSGLVRDKYERKDYLARTIIRAVARCSEIYIDKEQAPTPAKPRTGKLNIRKASEIEPEPMYWLWEGWLPKEALCIYAGQGGIGKSTVTLSWAATVTKGSSWPNGSLCENPGRVLIWSGEDGVANTLRPRLEAAGADLDMVDILDGVEEAGVSISFDPSKHIPLLKEEYKRGDLALLIIDPLVSAITGNMDKTNEVRRGLQPIVDFAVEIGCGVVGLTHFTKGSAGKNPLERILGSGGFGHVARTVIVGAQEEDTRDCVIAVAKTNFELDNNGYAYNLERFYIPSKKGPIKSSRAVWRGVVEGSARGILSELEDIEEKVSPRKIEEAKEFLKIALSSQNLPLRQLVKQSGFSKTTLKSAKKLLPIKSIGNGPNAEWTMLYGMPT